MKQVKPHIYARVLLASVSAPALFWSSGALAQNAQSADEAVGDGNAIVVTARRFAEKLQDVPISVSSISAQDLARQNLDDLSDVAEKTVGFAFETFTGPLAQPVIRGQTNLRVTSPVQNVSNGLTSFTRHRSQSFGAK